MKCKYCGAEIKPENPFCDRCGQHIDEISKSTVATNKYWKDIDALNNADEKKFQEAINKAKVEKRKRKFSRIIKLVIAAVIGIGVIITINILDSSSQEKLEFVKKSSIGKTYSDTAGAAIMAGGDERDRTIITFKDEKTLNYIRGNYTLRISKDNDGYSSTWKQNQIYENRDYEYHFSTTLFGEITLECNGKSYAVDLEEDGTINTIYIYEN